MKNIKELDGIRGIAILLVLVWHYFVVQLRVEDGTLLYYLRYMGALTWSGVDLFFVLSGFLIGGILLDNKNSSNYLSTFFIRRICRIFPLYFMLLLLFFLFSKLTSAEWSGLFTDPYPLWSYITFTQNYMMGNHGFGSRWLGVTWSLAIEEQFYLLLPFLVLVLKTNRLVTLLGIMIVASPVARYMIDGMGSYIYTFCRADALMSGVLLAWLVRKDGFIELSRKYSHLIITLFTALLLVIAYLAYSVTQAGDVVNHFVFAIFYSLLILLAVIFRDTSESHVLRNTLLVWLGTRSYGIYLLHQGIGATVHSFNGNNQPQISNVHDAMFTVSALLMTLLLAELSFRYYEKPFIRIGHKLRYEKKSLINSP